MDVIFSPQKSIKTIEVEKNYNIDNYMEGWSDLGYSVVRTHLKGKHPLMKNTISNRTYYIINGNGVFYANTKEYNVQTGDMITIPKNTKYKFDGEFDAILISNPAFNEKYDIIYTDDEKQDNE